MLNVHQAGYPLQGPRKQTRPELRNAVGRGTGVCVMGPAGDEQTGRAAYGQRMPSPSATVHGELIVEKLPAAWLVILRGEHDLATAHTVDAQLDALLLHGANVIVDLSDADFIDSSIVSAIFRGLRYITDGGDGALVVCAREGSFARRVFEQIGMIDAIPFFDRRRDAVALFESA